MDVNASLSATQNFTNTKASLSFFFKLIHEIFTHV